MNLKEASQLYIKNIIKRQEEPNGLGEMLRSVAFVPDEFGGDYGCYSTFEVHPDFKKVEAKSTLGKKLIIAMLGNSVEDRVDGDGKQMTDDQVVEEFLSDYSSVDLYTSGDIHLAWYWEGDGTLLFAIESEKFALINRDCKKDYGWEQVCWK
ncbi:MAG: hypothetical protein KGH64_06000 [Candidatus Micrarchaeota archaeon]|nr:hypothetical protein [Candidatus Micrarchaeota archaeon]